MNNKLAICLRVQYMVPNLAVDTFKTLITDSGHHSKMAATNYWKVPQNVGRFQAKHHDGPSCFQMVSPHSHCVLPLGLL